MTFEEKLEKLDEENLYFSDRFSAQILLIVQNLLQDLRDNEPLEEWSYEKIIKLSNKHGRV